MAAGETATTFLLTGVERYVPLWEIAPDTAAAAIARHHEIIDAVVRARDGSPTVVDDSVLARFPTAEAAVAAALAIQRALGAEAWPAGVAIRVRIGVATGVDQRANDADSARRHCARLRAVAHDGQTLLSAATADLVADALPDNARLADLGVHRLRDLSRSERLYELRHPDLRQDFPPLRSLDLLPNNLPAQLTSFVGRADEVAELERLLGEQRLVTIAGAGGCGKSRLAVQVAAELIERWPDGVWWVDLGAITDPELVVEVVASTLQVLIDPSRDPLPVLAGQLRRRRLLLCLDTCEHVLDACAEVVDTILRACPDVAVLATSREPLGVAGETVWRVPSLVEAEAVRLFADRAALVRSESDAGVGDEDAVRTICRRLDGIPLAIELAAAWMRALTPAQIVGGLDDRFRLLTGGPRVATRRQQTLAASMEWSHDLLTDADRVVFRRLAVFSAPFTLDAAQTVCVDGDEISESDVLAVLGRLVDKSLVSVRTGAGEARYHLLDTIRQYAENRLRQADEETVTRDRHLDYFLALAERAEPELDHAQDTWRKELERRRDDIHTALNWGLGLAAAGGDRGRRLAAAMARQWFIRGQSHAGLEFLQRAVALDPDDRSVLQARLLAGTAMLGIVSGRPGLMAESAERGRELAVEVGDERTRSRCLAILADRWSRVDFERGRALAEEAHAVGEAAGDPFARDFALMIGAYVLMDRDRHDEATALARSAFEQSLPRGDRFCAAFALCVEFWATLVAGDLRRAVELGEEAVRIAEPAGDYFCYGTTTTNLAIVKGLVGEIDAARRLIEPIVRAVETTPDTDVVGLAAKVGQLHMWRGDLEGAAGWFERDVPVAEPKADNATVVGALSGLASVLRRLGRIDEARHYADRAATAGRAVGWPRGLARAIDEQAFLAADDDPPRAEDLHHEALAVRVGSGLRLYFVDSLDALARVASRAESCAEAVRLLAASDCGRVAMRYPRPPINVPEYEELVAQLRTAMSEAEFDVAWAEGAALSLDEAVTYAARGRGTRSRPSTGWASLTPAEREVVRLVVDGLTNPQIAARLFVSRATVKTHLSHVYAKLGVANRTELAAVAKEHQP